MQPWWA